VRRGDRRPDSPRSRWRAVRGSPTLEAIVGGRARLPANNGQRYSPDGGSVGLTTEDAVGLGWDCSANWVIASYAVRLGYTELEPTSISARDDQQKRQPARSGPDSGDDAHRVRIRQTWRRNRRYGAQVLFTLDLRSLTADHARKAVDDAAGLQDEQVLGSTVDELVAGVLERHDLEVPVLHSERRELSDTGSQGGVRLHVPFSGTPALWSFSPNLHFGSGPPQGELDGSEIVVELGRADSGVEARADQWTSKVQQLLDHMRDDLEIWRTDLRHQLHSSATRRRAEAEQHQAGLRGIGIPIRRRGDAPSVFREPAIVRRKPPTRAQPAAGVVADAEPALSGAYYEHILFVIRAAGRAMERAPETYSGWGEEDRRQVLILMLNTHYAGKVFAEAFNGDGKTDILIREEDRNVFIGECKFYEGPKTVQDTVDQIFGYATWRDVRLAIIFFVDRVNFTEAIKRIKDTLGERPQFRGWVPLSEEHEREFRAEMVWPGDDLCFVTLHVSCFLTPRSAQVSAELPPEEASPAA
jgi:hypothetical protein